MSFDWEYRMILPEEQRPRACEAVFLNGLYRTRTCDPQCVILVR